MKGKGARLRGRTASRATACPPEHTTGSATARSWIATSGSRSATEPSGADAHSSCREIDGQVVWCLSRVPRSMLQIYVCANVHVYVHVECLFAPLQQRHRLHPQHGDLIHQGHAPVSQHRCESWHAHRARAARHRRREQRAAHERCGTWDRPCRRSNVMRTHF